MSLSARERRLGAVTGVIGVVVIGYLAVDRWAIPTWRGLQEDMADRTEQLEHLTAAAAKAGARQDLYVQRAGLALRAASPEAAESAFLNQLNALARAASMPPPSIKTLSPKRESHYDLVQFNFTVKCSLAQLLAFLRHFYAQETAQRIDTITFSPGGRFLKPDDPLNVTMMMSAVVIPEGGKKPPKEERRAAS